MGVAETVRVSRKGSAGLTYRRIRQSGHCLAEAVWKSAAQGLESGKQPASQPSQAPGDLFRAQIRVKSEIVWSWEAEERCQKICDGMPGGGPWARRGRGRSG